VNGRCPFKRRKRSFPEGRGSTNCGFSHPDFYTAAPRDQDARANVILSSMTAFGPIGT